MKIVFVLYEEMTALDLIGPYQVLSFAPDAQVTLAATSAGPKKTDSGIRMYADVALKDVRDADVIVVPGTSRPELQMADRELLDWLADASKRAQWTTSVCTGSLILGAAGLLRGKRATTHWMVHDALRELGAEPVRERVVVDGQLVTAAGVSAGIDMALSLVARIWSPEVAQAIQLGIEYDPKPPFSAGSPDTAGADIVQLAIRMMTAAAPNLVR
ncbi:MAG: DJ-1/PfpI family protein [Polyangiales bacterium]